MNNWCSSAARRRRALRFLLFAVVFRFENTADAAVDVQLVASGLANVVGIEHAGDGSGRLFLVRQSGQIVIYDGTQVLPTPFLDLSGLVLFGGERGLLGLAFHANYSSNGLFFVNYTNTSSQTVIARYRVSGNPNLADPGSQTILLTESQPFGNHNGGQLRFGPDGFLYIALGDGGSSGNPTNSAQSLDTILGKLLRIDVDSGSPYTIPPSNPFASTPGARGEIWAYGLRNPWRFSFDRQTGDLFIGDVGQNLWEEVSYQSATSPGGENYGWRLMEGLHCFNPSSACNNGSLKLPVVEYSHTLGCSITGGFRYRGSLLAGHAGAYFFADLCSGRIWSATAKPDGTWSATLLLATGLTITTFGEDSNGELYFSNYGPDGQLYRLVPATSPSPLLTVSKAGAGGITSSPVAIECGKICGAQLASGAAVTLAATPDPGWTFVGWSGDADCSDGVLNMSADQSCTATFGLPFTDDPLVSGSTTVKAVHVTELRSRINAVRARVGLSQFSWTNPTLIAANTFVSAIHITEMRTALKEAFSAAGRPEPIFTDAALSAGHAIRAVHISDLRSACVTLE